MNLKIYIYLKMRTSKPFMNLLIIYKYIYFKGKHIYYIYFMLISIEIFSNIIKGKKI